ncbi:MAG: hypothetical protein MR765_00095 [Tenericutes bacterium]|nr:hypothetical protein [Mycoplasmatota bacterium]
MKNFKFKDLIFPTIVSFVLSFMLIIYEPIITYAANTDDYWFSFKTLILNNLLLFLILFCVGVIFSLIVYILTLLIKKRSLYNLYLVLLFVAFIATYIQGNFMAGSLPTLDGSPIIWGDYTKLGVISIALWCILLGLSIFLFVKYKEKVFTYMKYISLAVFAMLFVSFCTTLLTSKDIYANKGTFTATNENLTNLSQNKNFLILLVDMEDSKTFSKVLKQMNKEDIFKDFTYFPDTLSAYPFTRESIPFVLSGEWFEEQKSFTDYYNDALNNSKFLEELKNQNYDLNIYESDLNWTDTKALDVNNIKAINFAIDKISLYKQEFKYILFKYLPFPLKKYSKIEWIDYKLCRKENLDSDNLFNMDNKVNYDLLDEVNIQKNNYFHFLHLDGGHFPWDVDSNFNKIENGTYEQKIEASIKVIDKYIKRIKDSNLYDNSVIIVLADHGNNGYEPVGRQNPILYIKGINEKHNKLIISDKKVSYTDLNDSIYYDLLNGKSSSELLPNVEKNRIRRFIWYKEYDELYEQFLDGHAWETNKLKNSGKKYFK